MSLLNRAVPALALFFGVLGCGGLMPLGDPIPEGEPGLLNLPEFNGLTLGMSFDDAGWAAPDALDGGLVAKENFGARIANCKMVDAPMDYADRSKGTVLVGMRCIVSRDWSVGRLEEAWGTPDAEETYTFDGRETTQRFWLNEADRVKAVLVDTERTDVLTLQIQRYDPIEEILGDGELYPFQTRRWVGERMNQMEDQKMFMKGRTGFVDAHGVPRYGDRPRVWLSHAMGEDDWPRVTGWEMTLFYRSDQAHRDAIIEAVSRKVGKKPTQDGKRLVFGDAANTQLLDLGTRLKLTVGTVPENDQTAAE